MKYVLSLLLILGVCASGIPPALAEQTPGFESVPVPPRVVSEEGEAPAEIETYIDEALAVQVETTEVIVKVAGLDAGDAGVILEDVLAESNATLVEILPDAESALIELPTGSENIEMLEDHPLVEYAEPNYTRTSFVSWADDTFADRLWALENTGQEVSGVAGTADADIDAVEAWNLSLGTSTLVAVIDSGILYTHPDLNDSLWDGSACVDDQGAPLGGCQYGYDYLDNDTDPLPDATATTSVGHGTHVAGIIAAERNNGAGVVGAAPAATIMSIKFAFDVASEVKAIDFARQNGAKIINASYGGESFSQAEYDAIQRFTDAGGLFIAAAGNDARDSDTDPLYPAAYDLPGIIAVAATDQDDDIASFSNYGEETVDLGAPGVRIASTFTDDASTAQYAYRQGTSMAAPFVAATAALVWSAYPSLTNDEVKAAILTAGDDADDLIATTVTGKRLNAHRALLAAGGADVVAPVITLNGGASLTLTVGDAYIELGATATDNVDATTTVSISGTVDTTTAGTYTLTYDADDQAGNAARSVTRTVTVQNPVSSGGGGGGGGSSRKRGGGGGGGSTLRKKAETVVVAPSNPARPALSAPVIAAQPTPPAVPFFRTLTIGSAGADVTALQQALIAKGVYAGPVTGYFGPLTQAGVRAYQALHGLEQVGVVGPLTRQLLKQGQ